MSVRLCNEIDTMTAEKNRLRGIWVMAGGKKIKISKMEDSHLENTIKMLRRKIRELPPDSYYIGNSYYAEDAVEAENRAKELYEEELSLWIDRLREEQKMRVERKQGKRKTVTTNQGRI